MQQIEISFINQLCQDIAKLNGTDFEYFCKDILGFLVTDNIYHKGHNLYAKPVKSTADFNTNNFRIIGQCGTDQNYFDDLKKPLQDIYGAIKNHSQSQIIYLFANQRASGGQLSKLNAEITNQQITQSVETFDSEKIANIILEKILNDTIQPLLETYTPFAFELYRTLPHTNQLPNFTSKRYFERDIETSIIEKLREKKILQLFGISGIGKSELSKSIAKKMKNEFETIIWVNGDDLQNSTFDFMAVHISKFNAKINIKSLILNHKIILILDNFNENINAITTEFEALNNKGSICLITSLQQNLAKVNAYEVSFLSDKISEQILFETDNPPTTKIASSILEYVNGYPLLLNIIRDNVEKEDDTWENILEDIQDVVTFEDPERNVKIATRILTRSCQQIEEELKWIFVLNSRFVSREFLKYVLGHSGTKSLIKRSIMMQTETSYYTIHQIILDTIQHLFDAKSVSTDFVYEKLEKYFGIENNKKSVGYYNFLFNHASFIEEIYAKLCPNNLLKQEILYAMVQVRDERKGNWFLDEIKKYDLTNTTKIEILLLIEKLEIELFNAKNELKKDNPEKYTEICQSKIDFLENLIKTSSIEGIELYLKHHLGKIYLRIQNYHKALELFDSVLEKDQNADYARLQIARIWVWHDATLVTRGTLETILDSILNNSKNWENQSLSVLLATYELIAENKMKEFREKYIDTHITDFIEKLFYSLSFGFEQPFELLAKLSYYFSYNKQEIYIAICESLPLPATIEQNDNVKFAFATIQVAYYKSLKYSTVSEKDIKMDRAFNLAETYYQAINLNDFQRGKFVDLYIEAEKFVEALSEINKYENKEDDPFYYQKLCKIHRNLNNVRCALTAIEKAIDMSNNNQKYINYKSAFLNDKAETIYKQSATQAIEILENAISLELNKNTVKTWQNKMQKWKKAIN